MARLTWDELDKIKQKYGVSILWSWSRIQSYVTSHYEYYLKYVLHKKEDISNCAYAPCGSLAHDCVERYYNGEDGWLTNIDIADLKFDRNDSDKNESIKKKYKYDIEHFLKNHNCMADKVITEKFVTAKICNHVLQGYIDAVYKDEDGNFCIIDFKTSTKFSGKNLDEKSGQLTVYAIALTQMGVPLDKIHIGFNMLKYCTVEYRQKNGAVKTRDVERYKIGESLQTNAKMWLKDAGVAIPTYNVEEPKSPLKLASSRNLFKLFSNDVGLLACQYSDGIQLKVLKGDDAINYGSIYENVVAQELRAHGFSELYYYNSKKMGEVDFVVEHNGEVFPIEVKSGKDYARHRALNNILDCGEYNIPESVVLCNDNYTQKDKVTYAPIYMVMFIHKDHVIDVKFSLDLSGL